MNTKIAQLLEEGRVHGFWAYKTVHGFPFPWLFTKENRGELEPWRLNAARYPILKLLLAEARRNPDKPYGVLVRGCEERGLEELFKWNQLQRDKVVVLGQSCSEELASYCECRKPYPDRLDYGAAVAPVTESLKLKDLKSKDADERLDWWLGHLNRCIRCYGCRDVCPVCFCTECSLEHLALIPGEKLPRHFLPPGAGHPHGRPLRRLRALRRGLSGTHPAQVPLQGGQPAGGKHFRLSAGRGRRYVAVHVPGRGVAPSDGTALKRSVGRGKGAVSRCHFERSEKSQIVSGGFPEISLSAALRSKRRALNGSNRESGWVTVL